MPDETVVTALPESPGWKNAFSDKRFQRQFIFTMILLAIVLFSFTRFIDFVQRRDGIVLPDPVLQSFNPINLTWFIFGLIYASLIITIISLANKPKLLVTALQVYSLMMVFRIIAMYSIPLDPPEKMIILKDPFVEFFTSGPVLTKDLFFSGHTATLFILFLVVKTKKLRFILLIFTIIVASFLLLQHVHYTIDVVSAPFFAYGSYKIVSLLHEKLNI